MSNGVHLRRQLLKLFKKVCFQGQKPNPSPTGFCKWSFWAKLLLSLHQIPILGNRPILWLHPFFSCLKLSNNNSTLLPNTHFIKNLNYSCLGWREENEDSHMINSWIWSWRELKDSQIERYDGVLHGSSYYNKLPWYYILHGTPCHNTWYYIFMVLNVSQYYM